MLLLERDFIAVVFGLAKLREAGIADPMVPNVKAKVEKTHKKTLG